ncbi:hypothetical protein IBE33_09525, partial [Francisella philomiragia]|uniref:hypothetical protein n=1 Tax=Francisella philomiragia TaxID=28110 RepID=UPI0019066A51
NKYINDNAKLIYNDNNKLIYQAESLQYQEIEKYINNLKSLYKIAWESHYKKQIKSYKTELPRIVPADTNIININQQKALKSVLYNRKKCDDVKYTLLYRRLDDADDESAKKWNKHKIKYIKKRYEKILDAGLNCTLESDRYGHPHIYTKPIDIMDFLSIDKVRIKSYSGDTVRAYFDYQNKQQKLNFQALVVHENSILQVTDKARNARKDKRQDEIILFPDIDCDIQISCYPF